MRRRAWIIAAIAVFVTGLSVAAVLWAILNHPPDPADCERVERCPRIFPEYVDVVLPPNIAPLNFVVKEPGTRYYVSIKSTEGEPVTVLSGRPQIVIPMGPWRRLLEANRGRTLTLTVCVREKDGRWRTFKPITNTIAAEDIDPWLVYRLMPLYNLVGPMGTYQRDLRSFEVTPVLRSGCYHQGCANCHSFLHKKSAQVAMNVRSHRVKGKPRGGLLIARDGVVEEIVDTRTPFNPIPAIYLAWHPSGRAIAFSTNKVLQCFHTIGDGREAVDRYSDMGLYLMDSNTISTSPALARGDRFETWPEWTPDGRTLYFCSAPALPVKQYKRIRYSLMRVSYDLETNTWGEPETVLSAEETGCTFIQPAFSPDGRYVLLTVAPFGSFGAYLRDSDLHMMDVDTGTLRPLNVNSDRSDSYHTWSSNSRWIVFSSKRLDGLFARPFISYVDESGNAHKPLLLPQEDPSFYDSCIDVFNVPELVGEPVSVTERELVDAILSTDRYVKSQLDPAVNPEPPHKFPDKDAYQRGRTQ